MCPVDVSTPGEDPDTEDGWGEDDEPNFSFRSPPCSFYSGRKALRGGGSGRGGELFCLAIKNSI